MTPCDAAPLLPLAVVVEAAADELDELEPKGEVAVAEPAAEPVVDGVPDEPEPEAVEVAERVTPTAAQSCCAAPSALVRSEPVHAPVMQLVTEETKPESWQRQASSRGSQLPKLAFVRHAWEQVGKDCLRWRDAAETAAARARTAKKRIVCVDGVMRVEMKCEEVGAQKELEEVTRRLGDGK